MDFRALPSFRLKQLWLPLMAAVVIARAIVPVGFMVEWSSEGKILLELCGDGSGGTLQFDPQTGMTELVHAGTPPHDPSDDSEDNDTCPFALSSIVALGLSSPEPILQEWVARLIHLPTHQTGISHGARAPPPARAPPVLS